MHIGVMHAFTIRTCQFRHSSPKQRTDAICFLLFVKYNNIRILFNRNWFESCLVFLLFFFSFFLFFFAFPQTERERETPLSLLHSQFLCHLKCIRTCAHFQYFLFTQLAYIRAHIHYFNVVSFSPCFICYLLLITRFLCNCCYCWFCNSSS